MVVVTEVEADVVGAVVVDEAADELAGGFHKEDTAAKEVAAAGRSVVKAVGSGTGPVSSLIKTQQCVRTNIIRLNKQRRNPSPTIFCTSFYLIRHRHIYCNIIKSRHHSTTYMQIE